MRCSCAPCLAMMGSIRRGKSPTLACGAGEWSMGDTPWRLSKAETLPAICSIGSVLFLLCCGMWRDTVTRRASTEEKGTEGGSKVSMCLGVHDCHLCRTDAGAGAVALASATLRERERKRESAPGRLVAEHSQHAARTSKCRHLTLRWHPPDARTSVPAKSPVGPRHFLLEVFWERAAHAWLRRGTKRGASCSNVPGRPRPRQLVMCGPVRGGLGPLGMVGRGVAYPRGRAFFPNMFSETSRVGLVVLGWGHSVWVQDEPFPLR